MAGLSVRLFGSFQVQLNGEVMRKFRTKKVKALLCYLLTEQAYDDWPLFHRRQELMALLWPDLSEQNAQANLRQILYHLQQSIPCVSIEPGQKQPLLLVDRQTIGIHPAAIYELDLDVFTRLVANSQNHRHRDISTCASCVATLHAAADLYRADFLSDFFLSSNQPFEEWALLRREQLRQKALQVLAIITSAAQSVGDYQLAQNCARRQLEIDNLHDRAYRQLIKAQACAGNRSDALLTYRGYVRLLERELGVSPTGEVAAMADAIQAGRIKG